MTYGGGFSEITTRPLRGVVHLGVHRKEVDMGEAKGWGAKGAVRGGPGTSHWASQKREREETGKVHAEADARCGRDWLTGGCMCGACRQVKAELAKAKKK